MSSLWRQPDFARLWAGQTVSQIGSQAGGTAFALLAVLTLQASPVQLGVLSSLRAIPALALGLFAGVVVDRVRRRPLLVAADLGRAALLALIPALAMAGALRMEHLYAVTLAVTTLAVLFEVAYPAYLPALVDADKLVEGNSKLAMGDAVAEIIGPGLGGALAQALSPAVAVGVDAASFLVSALSLGLIRRREPPPTPPAARRSALAEAAEGLRLTVRDPILRPLLLSESTLAFAGGIIGALYVIFVTQTLAIAPAVMGVIIGIGGASALVGAAIAERVTRRLGIGRAMILSRGLGTISGVLMALAGGPAWLAVGLLALSQITDATWSIFNTCDQALRQSVTPPAFLGRVTATSRLATGALLPLGALAGGILGEAIGLRAGIGIGLLLDGAAILWLVFSPIRRLTATGAHRPAADG